MRAVLVQATPAPGDLGANVERACEAVEAAGRGALVVFPELFLSGYRLDGLAELAVTEGHPAVTRIAEAARGTGAAVVIGAPERLGRGYANSALCIDESGRLAGVYRKTHLFGAERSAFVAGDVLEPVALDRAHVGVMVCFDLEFPEVARTLTLRGADLLVTISANMAPFAEDHASFARARALENERPHLYVNRTGEESGAAFVGGSCAVDSEGRVIAGAGATPATLTVEVPKRGRRDERTRYLAQRRRELYAD